MGAQTCDPPGPGQVGGQAGPGQVGGQAGTIHLNHRALQGGVNPHRRAQ